MGMPYPSMPMGTMQMPMTTGMPMGMPMMPPPTQFGKGVGKFPFVPWHASYLPPARLQVCARCKRATEFLVGDLEPQPRCSCLVCRVI